MKLGKSISNIIENSLTVTRENTLWSNVWEIINSKIDYRLKRNVDLVLTNKILEIMPIATDEIR